MSKDMRGDLLAALLAGRAKMGTLDLDPDEDDDDEDEGRSRKKKKLNPEIEARVLLDMGKLALRPNPFQVGDLIQQQKEREFYRYPGIDGELALVTAIVEKEDRIPAEHGPNDHTWSVNDIVILTRAKGRWVHFKVDSWRFEKYDGPIEE